MAKRAFHEWLEVMPSDRIMWGADCNHAEGIYGATELTRRCLAEVLAEKVDRGDLREEHAAADRPADPPRQRPGAVPAIAASAVEGFRKAAAAVATSLNREVIDELAFGRKPADAFRISPVTFGLGLR